MIIKKIILKISISLLIFFSFSVRIVTAQENNINDLEVKNNETKKEELLSIITSEDSVFIDKKILFDATDSKVVNIPAPVSYGWDFGDGSFKATTKEVLHGFKETGKYTITLTLRQGDKTSKTEKDIFVYNKKVILITDTNKQEELNLISEQASDSGVLLQIVSTEKEETGFLTEDKFVNIFKEKKDTIFNADILIFYTKASLGIQAFTRYWQLNDIQLDLKDKFIVKITDENMSVDAKIAQQSFDITSPNYILLTRKEALNPILHTANNTDIVNNLKNRGIEYKIIDERTERLKIFVLSNLITSFVSQGIPTNTIYLILVIPFITFLIAFSRQVIGVSSFGVYTPTILSVTFLLLGINFGLGALFIVVLVSYLFRLIIQKFELLYIPRLSLVLSLISLSLLAAIWFLLRLSTPEGIVLAIFPMIVMSTVSEKFIAAQSEEGLKSALFGVFETILISIVAYYFVIWTSFSNLLVSMPELIIIPIIGSVLLGKFTGLRLSEYFRFRSLFKDNTEE